MTEHHRNSDPSRDRATARLVAALSDPEYRFDAGQVAYLMSAAARWAREDTAETAREAGRREAGERITQLNLEAIAAGVRAPAFSEIALRREGYRQTARREWDAAAVWEWHGDHPGGAVPVWPAERADLSRPCAPGRCPHIGQVRG